MRHGPKRSDCERIWLSKLLIARCGCTSSCTDIIFFSFQRHLLDGFERFVGQHRHDKARELLLRPRTPATSHTDHSIVSNYLMFRLSVRYGLRTGQLTNLTLAEFSAATERSTGHFDDKVAKHKTWYVGSVDLFY